MMVTAHSKNKTKPKKHINANILLILAYLWEVSH